MLTLITVLILIILLSRITEETTKIPSTLAIILYAFLLSIFLPHLFSISSEEFNEILYLMLPIILLPDILNISIKELKLYAKEIFYLAVVSVIVSIALASFVTPYILPEYSFTFGMLLALFTMLMATDAITVSSIMARFKLPNRLKIYAESESLFNDVTALIIYYFIALPLLEGSTVDAMSVNLIVFKVLFFSTLIGVATASVGFFAIKILRNPFDQFLIIYLIVIVSFLIAEHFHIAGILSIVAAVITFKILVQREGKKNPHLIEKQEDDGVYTTLMEFLKNVPAITKHEFREYKKEAMFVGVFANAVVFTVIANIIDLHLLLRYWYEIMIVFAITSVIRFASVASLIASMKLPFYWTKTLTLSGTKGALAIIMVHSLPAWFVYKDLFTAVVIGNVIISTFIYTFLLMWHIASHAKEYESDCAQENIAHDPLATFSKELVGVLEKDVYSKAYNRIFIEDILAKELARVQRYKIELSAIVLKLTCQGCDQKQRNKIVHAIGSVITDDIRTNDYFGKLDEERFVILATNTSLSGALVLAQKIEKQLEEILDKEVGFHFGVTEAHETDDVTAIFEKLGDAVVKSIENKKRIEIEV
ncbi:MAG: cation:proton antiporter [Sulfurimonadaceae bacterium]